MFLEKILVELICIVKKKKENKQKTFLKHNKVFHDTKGMTDCLNSNK